MNSTGNKVLTDNFLAEVLKEVNENTIHLVTDFIICFL